MKKQIRCGAHLLLFLGILIIGMTGGTLTAQAAGAWTGEWSAIGGETFMKPGAIAVDQQDNVYVVDAFVNDIKKKAADESNWVTITNHPFQASSYGDWLRGVAADGSNNIYVLNSIDSTMDVIWKYNGGNWTDITYNNRFYSPESIVADGAGNVYVTDSYPESPGSSSVAGHVWKLAMGSTTWVEIGNISNGGFRHTTAVAADKDGNVYVTDYMDATQNSSQYGTIQKLVSGSTKWESLQGGFSMLIHPYAVTIDKFGNLYVADRGTGYIHTRTADSSYWSLIRKNSTERFDQLNAIEADNKGNVYIIEGGDSFTTRRINKHQSWATQLIWQTQPGGAAAGSPLTTQPAIILAGPTGDPITASDRLYASLDSTGNVSGATLSGEMTANFNNGIATFSNLAVDKPGDYKLYLYGYINSSYIKDLPGSMVDRPSCDLNTVSNSFTITPMIYTLKSITAPAPVTGLANGTDKSAEALGLPGRVTMVTDKGDVQAQVSWDVAGCAYDPANASAQSFTVSGTAVLPSDVVNPSSVNLTTGIQVSVNQATAAEKILLSITSPAAINGLANGTAKDSISLKLPEMVMLVTETGNVPAKVTWNVLSCTYDPANKKEQSFTVSGTIPTLPTGVENPNNISLNTSINVTVNAEPSILLAIYQPSPNLITVDSGTAKDAGALGLPETLTMITDKGNLQAKVNWDVANCEYNPAIAKEQNFTIYGTVVLPAWVTNPNNISQQTYINVKVKEAPAILMSITTPANIYGLANGTVKTAAALGLSGTVTMVTDKGNLQAQVDWDVANCAYDPANASAQNFTVSGTAVLPSGVANPSSVSLKTGISVTVNAAASTDKTLTSIIAPDPVTGVANGTAKDAGSLGLPAMVEMVTDQGSVSAKVNWDVASCSYDPTAISDQSFTVSGTAVLPTGVINPNTVSLKTGISVSVNGKSVILLSIITPSPVTGVAGGTEKTAAALGLPGEVTIVTDQGTVTGKVNWDVASCPYDPVVKEMQSFTVSGTAVLPVWVTNPNNVNLNTGIDVSVNKVFPIMKSIITPDPVTGRANGTAKTTAGLGLSSIITVETDQGMRYVTVNWDVASCSYVPAKLSAQNFTVSGTVVLPQEIKNPNMVSLVTGIQVTVNASETADKTLKNIVAATPINGVASGTAKTAAALGLPLNVMMETDLGMIQANVIWDVASCSYDPAKKSAQSFTVSGTAILPNKVINPNNVSLHTGIPVTVKAAPPTPTPGGGGNTRPAADGSYSANTTYVDPSGAGWGDKLPVNFNKNTGKSEIVIDKKPGSVIAGGGNVVITSPSIPGAKEYSLGIPIAYLSTKDGNGLLTFISETGSLVLPADMMAGTSGAEGKNAQISISKGDKSSLPEDVKAAIGDRPLIQLTVMIDGRPIVWNNPKAPVTVSIPYKPTKVELENPESIVIWYIDTNGKAISVPNGHYDPATGTVIFTTTHFSSYSVGCNQVSFKDVTANVWYEKAVNFVAARGITTGTDEGKFSPQAKLTRGEFLVMLMKAYGMKPQENAEDNFADAGNCYYTGYLAAAKSMGISQGAGNNLFAPDKKITRQEMFTLLYNVLKKENQLPEGKGGKAISAFSDAGEVSGWATEALTLMTQTGTISGNGGKLLPASTTTRAELAQVLYNLLSK